MENEAPHSKTANARPPFAGIDHAILGVRDLEAASAQWRRLGFTLTPRGRHVGWGTANYCVMFKSDYLELLGIVDPAKFTNDLDKFLAEREGLLGLAFATSDADATAAALRARGLDPGEPKDLGRLLELPQGDATLRFRLAMPPAGATPGLSAFWCQHLTPDLLRWPGWTAHANTATRIKTITAHVDDPVALAEPYERLFGAGSATLTDDTLAVRTGGGVLFFARLDDVSMLHPAVEPPDAVPPAMVALSLGVRDPDAARTCLEAAGVPFQRDGDGTLRVAPAYANGAILELQPE